MEHAVLLRDRGRGGVIGVLGDEHAAFVAQSLRGVALGRSVGPGGDVLDRHRDLRNDGAGAQIESGEAGDDLGERVRADIADLGLIRGDLAGVDELLDLHTGDDTGDITAFIDVGEGVVAVVETGKLRVQVRAADELHIGVVGSSLEHVRLVAIGVADDDIAAGLGQLDAGVGAAVVFADVRDDVPVKGNALGGHLLRDGVLRAIEVVGVALIVLVADADHADLQGLAFGVVAVFFGRLRLVVAAFRRGVVRGVLRFLIVPAVRTAGGEHADREHENEKQRKYLLQSFFLLDIVGSPQCAFAAVRP